MSNPYATISDLTTYGVPSTALGTLTAAQQNAALDAAAGTVDEHIAGRYQLPLANPIPLVFTEMTCVIAAWRLINVRGYNPNAPGDQALRTRYLDAMDQLGKIQRQALHPIANAQSAGPTEGAQPTVISSSVVDMSTGATQPNRGW